MVAQIQSLTMNTKFYEKETDYQLVKEQGFVAASQTKKTLFCLREPTMGTFCPVSSRFEKLSCGAFGDRMHIESVRNDVLIPVMAPVDPEISHFEAKEYYSRFGGQLSRSNLAVQWLYENVLHTNSRPLYEK